MSEDQLSKWKCSNNLAGSDHLFLLSWTLTLSSLLDNIFGSIYDLAKEANQNLDDFLKSNSGLASPNIIYVDYIDKAVCDVIISRNEIS